MDISSFSTLHKNQYTYIVNFNITEHLFKNFKNLEILIKHIDCLNIL